MFQVVPAAPIEVQLTEVFALATNPTSGQKDETNGLAPVAVAHVIMVSAFRFAVKTVPSRNSKPRQ
jgi:hypothetical protein